MGGKSQPTPAPPPQFDFAEIMGAMPMPHAPAAPQATGPSLAEQEESRRKEQGISDRDAGYSNYMDASGSATDFVNKEIDREQANARLLGIDYQITDEQKSGRINDYFATLWGEGEQSSLDALMKEWGDPEGHEGFTVTRGDGSKYEGADGGGSEEVVGSTGSGGGAKNILDDDEDTLGGSTSVLG